MYDYINLEDELQGMHNEVEGVVEKEISFNGEIFMTLTVIHDKTEGYYQLAHRYYSSSDIRLNTSSDIMWLFYKTYIDKEKIMSIFDTFKVTKEDVDMIINEFYAYYDKVKQLIKVNLTDEEIIYMYNDNVRRVLFIK